MRKLQISLSKAAAVTTAGIATLFLAASAFAANGYSLFGDATVVSGPTGNAVQLVSDADPGYGGIDFVVPAGTTFADLQTLSTDFNPTDDGCIGGSPRFQINVIQGGVEKNIFAYLGDINTPCVPNTWQNSGDLLSTGHTVDTSQLGGTFYHPYDLALAQFGALEVTGIQLVEDAGWASGGEQTVLVDNVVVNETTFTFEPNTPSSKDACKKDGWQSLEDADGNPFKNQGQCVSYFNHN